MNLAKYKHYLHVLRDSPSSAQKVILKHADKKLILAICEICLNILNANIQLSAQSRRVLERYKNVLRDLAYPQKSQTGSGVKGKGGKGTSGACLERKRTILLQKGNGAFLTTLISSALAGIVGKLVGAAISKRGGKSGTSE